MNIVSRYHLCVFGVSTRAFTFNSYPAKREHRREEYYEPELSVVWTTVSQLEIEI